MGMCLRKREGDHSGLVGSVAIFICRPLRDDSPR
jgi:hypothetical protein